jgi:signal transduction histidine kinase
MYVRSESVQQTQITVDEPGNLATVDSRTELLFLHADSKPTADASEESHLVEEMARLDRLNLIGEMAASVGHEVRNPMTTIRGYLQMLRGKKELVSFATQFDLMVEEIDRANSIITEFLSMARNKPSDQKPGRLDTVVEVLMPMLDAGALMSGKMLIFKGGPVPPILMADRDIRQLILNLVRNASEATPHGGQVSICTYVEADRVVLAIADQGTGISPEVQQKLGTAFFTTKEKGTGIGLTVCRHIAERHHANLAFRTGPQGTTFYVSFPMAGPDDVSQEK